MRNRRRFLKDSALISLAPALPSFLAKAALGTTRKENDRVLVVIQLDGGNDGINTVVSWKDEGYAKHRSQLRLPERELIKLTDTIAFHPRLRSASELFQDGRLSVVQGVGYPNPNRSHFRSMAIWHTAQLDEKEHAGDGWLGDAVSMQQLSKGPHAIYVGNEDLPVALRGRRCTATTIANPDDLRLRRADVANMKSFSNTKTNLADFVSRSVAEAYSSAKELADTTKKDSAARYPGSRLANRLKLIGQMIKSDAAARIYYTSQAGYDTHAVQLSTHGSLLGELSSSLKAFMNDMRDSGLEDRILVIAFSEFGRRVKENASLGTDHGTAGPVFLAGNRLENRLYGQTPSLLDLKGGDLKHSTDFRDVYSAVLTNWLNIERPATLNEFHMDGLFKA